MNQVSETKAKRVLALSTHNLDKVKSALAIYKVSFCKCDLGQIGCYLRYEK